MFYIFSFNREEDGGGGSVTMENEKRMRREIANSNERRRMQSINAGFQSLRTLLPHHEGEKLSKVSVVFGRLSSYLNVNTWLISHQWKIT